MAQQLRPALAELKAWQQVMQHKIDEAVGWQRDFRPLLTELVAHQRDSALALKAINSEIQHL
jgi:phytoene/squalene synthetase